MRSNEVLILQLLIGDEVGGGTGHPAGHGVEDAVDAIDHRVQDPGWLWGGRGQRPPERGGRRPSQRLHGDWGLGSQRLARGLRLSPLWVASWRLGEWLPLLLTLLRLGEWLPLLLWGLGHAHSPVVRDPGLNGDGRCSSVVLELVIVHVLAPTPRVLADCGGCGGGTVAIDHGEPLILGDLGEPGGQGEEAERGQAEWERCNIEDE